MRGRGGATGGFRDSSRLAESLRALSVKLAGSAVRPVFPNPSPVNVQKGESPLPRMVIVLARIGSRGPVSG